jgi:hypothetical protein
VVRLTHEAFGDGAVSALGPNLPAIAAHYRKTSAELKALLRQDHSLHVDREGRLYHVCNWPAQIQNSAQSADSTTNGLLPLDQTFLLHSRPGANRTIYLDFIGFTLSGTAWNTSYNSGADIVAPPWDIDGDPTTFSTSERTAIQRIWLRVSEDYSPYDVDVTTEYTGEATLTRSSNSDQVYGVRALVSPIGSHFGNPGGISYVGVFDDVGDKYKPSLIFPENLANSEKDIAEAISHEVGHSLGLSHDGTTNGSAYYSGQGNWAPIMGVGYYSPVTQFSKGEYSAANNLQDDLAIITQNGLSFRPDDFGDTIATAAPIGGTNISGVIEHNTDIDFFSVLTGDGTLQVAVSPAERGANLHLFVSLYNSTGLLVTNRDAADTSSGVQPVSISRTVTAGTCYISVEGRGSGDPATTGYSDYASLGQYTVAIIKQVLVLARPNINPAGMSGTNLTLQIPTQLNANYVLQTATNLASPVAWESISTNAGTGGTLTFSTPVSFSSARRFWRVMVY